MNALGLQAPVWKQVDAVVVGGSLPAVAAALAMAGRGLQVQLVTDRPYCGEDVCATLRLWQRGPGVAEASPPLRELAGALFGAAWSEGLAPTPLRVKTLLEEALLAAGVEFLYGAFPAMVLRSVSGQPAGILFAWRDGFFAVRSRLVIDATAQGLCARAVGMPTAGRDDSTPVEWVTIGGLPESVPDGFSCRVLPEFRWHKRGGGKRVAAQLFVGRAEAGLGGVAALLEAEARLRERLWYPGAAMQAERPFWGPGAGGQAAPADGALCDGRLWLAGPAGAGTAAAAAAFDEPVAALAAGHRIGLSAAGPVLAEAIAAREWDEGWRFTGMGQFGPSCSPLDSLIMALGASGFREGVEELLRVKIRALSAEDAFSHHRAVAEACERLGLRGLAPDLAALLQRPGMQGHAFTTLGAALAGTPAGATDTSTRERSLRELHLARALFRCGDHNGLGRAILERYARDLRGHYARHARAVLATAEQPA